MTESPKSGIEALLQWCKQNTAGYPQVRVDNFSTCWRDGLALGALIHKHRPDIIDYKQFSKATPLNNLELAFAAGTKLGIKNILQPEDFVNNFNEASVITYIAQYYFLFNSDKSKRASVQPSKIPENTPEAQKVEKLRSLMLQGSVELIDYVVYKQNQISKIETIEGIVAHSKKVKPIIAIGRLLKESSIPREDIPYTPPYHRPSLEVKVLEFHRFLDMILWEIRAQLLAIKTAVAKAIELPTLVNYAHILRDVKQIMANGREEDDYVPSTSVKPPTTTPSPKIPEKTPQPISTPEKPPVEKSQPTVPVVSPPSKTRTQSKLQEKEDLQKIDALLDSEDIPSEEVNQLLTDQESMKKFLRDLQRKSMQLYRGSASLDRLSQKISDEKIPGPTPETPPTESRKSEYNRKSFRNSLRVNDTKQIFEQPQQSESPTNYRKSVLKAPSSEPRSGASRVGFKEDTTVDSVDLVTGKIKKERYTVYKMKEIEQFTELLSLPCILEEEPSEFMALKKKKKKKNKSNEDENRVPFLQGLMKEEKKGGRVPFLEAMMNKEQESEEDDEEEEEVYDSGTMVVMDTMKTYDAGTLIKVGSDDEDDFDLGTLKVRREDEEDEIDMGTLVKKKNNKKKKNEDTYDSGTMIETDNYRDKRASVRDLVFKYEESSPGKRQNKQIADYESGTIMVSSDSGDKVPFRGKKAESVIMTSDQRSKKKNVEDYESSTVMISSEDMGTVPLRDRKQTSTIMTSEQRRELENEESEDDFDDFFDQLDIEDDEEEEEKPVAKPSGTGGGMSLKERMLKYAAEANALDTASNFEKEMNKDEDIKEDEDNSSLMLNKTKRSLSAEEGLAAQQKVLEMKRMSQSHADLRTARTDSVSSTDSPKRKVVLKTGFLFKLVDKGIKTWQLMYFELDSYMFSYYKNRGDKNRAGGILLETIVEMKIAENPLKGIYAFQVTTTTQIHFMYSRSREETYDWLSTITILQKEAKERLKRLAGRTEADGSIVLNVIVPSLHESKRIKFNAKAEISQVKKMILDKFKLSLEAKREPIDKYDVYVVKSSKWLDDRKKDMTINYYFKTQDVVEFRQRIDATTLAEPRLRGYLNKRDPSGLVKGWKRRYFLLKNLRLYYSTSDKEIDRPIAFVDLKRPYTVAKLPNLGPTCFSLSTLDRNFHLQADTTENMETWVAGLQAAIQYKKLAMKENSWIREIEKNEKEGFLTKQGAQIKSWKRRWFVMSEGFLYYYRIKNGSQERRGVIPLLGSKLEISNEIPIPQLGFQVITKGRSFHLYGDTDVETQDWIDSIKMHKVQLENQLESITVV